AATLMCSGVSKSGSPAPRPMTSRPAALSSRALLVTAMVGDGLMRSSREARNDTGRLHQRLMGGRDAGPHLTTAWRKAQGLGVVGRVAQVRILRDASQARRSSG